MPLDLLLVVFYDVVVQRAVLISYGGFVADRDIW